ncbi:hypothetical protein GEMRC1_006736 [Eukaryota sp. GEM-RC1]
MSIPHHHQSNGMVERRNRHINQTLKKILHDSNDFQNWSAHLPMVQLIINSKPHSVTKFSPFELIFGTSVDPRRPPSHALDVLSSCPIELSTDFCADLTEKTALLKRNFSIGERNSDGIPTVTYFPEGSLVLRYNESPGRLHGKWLGPFRVIESHTNSSRINLLNLVTKSTGYSSSHLCKEFVSSSDNPQYLESVAALDCEEAFIKEINSIDVTNGTASVTWIDGTTTTEPLSEIKKNKAYKSFITAQKSMTPTRRSRRNYKKK